MRAREFLKISIVEGQMRSGGKNNDWFKKYYALPFLEGLVDNQVYSFNIGGKNIDGVIQDPNYVAKAFKRAYDLQDEAILKSIVFDVEELDDEGNPTGQFYENVKLNQIFKDEKIKGELKPNLGNIAELILGCAVTAKFEAEGRPVTEKEVIDLAKRLADGKGQLASKAGKDAITFVATVPFIDKKAFYAYLGKDSRGKTVKDYNIPKDTISGIEQHLKSAVSYVNTSPRVAASINRAATDPGENEVEVLSDGGNAEQQKVTKVDLKISIDGQRFNLLSIKAGRVGQFGQVSGYEFETLNNFFEQSVGLTLSPKVQKSFATKETIPDSEELRQHNFNVGFAAAFKEMLGALNKLAKADPVSFVERVYNGIVHHATRNEENVEMVILSPSAKKAFSELTFGPELRNALDDYQLSVKEGASSSMHIIEVYGTPVTPEAKSAMGSSPELLVKYRSYMPKNAVRNIVEMGSLLKELADWEKIESKSAKNPKAAAVQQPVQQPVQQAPVQPNPSQLTGKNVTKLSGTKFVTPKQNVTAQKPPNREKMGMEPQ